MIDVSGTWNATAHTPMGDHSVKIDLEQNGSEVSGSLSAKGMTVSFEDGKLEGDTFTCSVKAKGMKAKVQGTVEGDKIFGTVKIPLAKFKFEGQRA